MARMDKGTKVEVSVHVDAPPDVVYKIVSDVTRMGEWSPETTKCEWIDGATGPEVGARFKGTNKRGFITWSTKPTVTAADPSREFAFEVNEVVLWTYAFETDGGGTKLSESFEFLRDVPWHFRFAHRWLMRTKDRQADLEEGMNKTLQRIKQVVESG
jgi:hypothetical protein